MHVRMYACMYACMHVWMYVCMYVHLYSCSIYLYYYIYIYREREGERGSLKHVLSKPVYPKESYLIGYFGCALGSRNDFDKLDVTLITCCRGLNNYQHHAHTSNISQNEIGILAYVFKSSCTLRELRRQRVLRQPEQEHRRGSQFPWILDQC